MLTVGRLDINTEGLLLLTNDGGLARVLELPATGWLRRYRVRAFGKVTQADLDGLKDGVAIDGVLYGAIEATLDKEQGDNVWMTVGLREGKNREVKRVLEHLGLAVNRLIRALLRAFPVDGPSGKMMSARSAAACCATSWARPSPKKREQTLTRRFSIRPNRKRRRKPVVRNAEAGLATVAKRPRASG